MIYMFESHSICNNTYYADSMNTELLIKNKLHVHTLNYLRKLYMPLTDVGSALSLEASTAQCRAPTPGASAWLWISSLLGNRPANNPSFDVKTKGDVVLIHQEIISAYLRINKLLPYYLQVACEVIHVQCFVGQKSVNPNEEIPVTNMIEKGAF